MANTEKAIEKIPRTKEEILKFLERTRKGDESTLPVIRLLLQDPAQINSFGGDLARQVQQTLIQNAGGDNLGFKEALTTKLDLLRKELAGANPTPLEALLVDRIVLCWLTLHDAEMRFIQAKNLDISQTDYWQQRIDASQRRYLAAIKTLASVRKLITPILQVNIAKKQVNIAGTTASTGLENSN